MTRTQIYLPDSLYRDVREFAKFQEVSVAELVRRGLEVLMRTTAPAAARKSAPPQWELPIVRPLGLRGDPFENEDWRLEANMDALSVAEVASSNNDVYGSEIAR